MCLGAPFLTYTVPGDVLVHRLHTGLYSLYIMNQGAYHYIDYVFGGFIPHIYCTRWYTCTQITYGTLFIIYNEPGGTPLYRLCVRVHFIIYNEPWAIPLYRLCVRVHFIIYNEPWGHTLIQSPKQPTPTYKKHTETVHRLPIACEIAVGSLWNGSVCFL